MTWDDDPELEDTDALAAPDYSSQPVLVEEPDDDDWAAPARPGTFAPDPASDAADDLLEEDWGPEKGFSDPTNSVRVWADPEGGLEKVRVSLSWRTRLDGRPLGEAVTVAFMLMQLSACLRRTVPRAAARDRHPTKHLPGRADQVTSG